MVEISQETLRGLYMILCGIPFNYSAAEVYDKAKPIMSEAHEEILRLGKEAGFDNRGGDL